MDCNRDEALRAKVIAEKKFTAKDFANAKKFALKAQNLYPSLEGISQMIMTLDVYLASESKINGESDLYGILCVNASADEETVKKQYRKLALQLHPDKNKSIGAEGAFQLVSQAWSVLSDKSRKMVYDQKRKVKVSHTKNKHKHSAHNPNNGFYDFANNGTSNKKSQSSVPLPSSNTFWTSCNRCKMQYEYLRVYLNHNLLCPNCHEAFLAVEMKFPANGATPNFSWTVPQQHRQKSKSNRKKTHGSSGVQHGANTDLYNNLNFQWPPSSAASQAANSVRQTYGKVTKEQEDGANTDLYNNPNFQWPPSSAASQAANSVDQTYGKVTKEQEAAQTNMNVPKFDRPAKKQRSITNATENGYGKISNSDAPEMGRTGGLQEAGRRRMPSRINKLNSVISQIDKRSLLFEKSKGELRKKLEEWNAAAATKLKGTAKIRQRLKQSKDNGTTKKASNADQAATPNSKNVSLIVPDPEFHDFDKNRLERSFEGDQVWATYDSEDGMPRLYAFIQKVISLRPFKLRMSFLNSKSNAELGPMNWVGSGFTKTCGNFRVSRYQVNDTVNIFSHRVRYEKGARGIIRIFPMQGETWALYKNWCPSWNELTPDDTIYKYEIVEVINDYSDEEGVLVTPLVKVAGFRAIFHRHLDPKEEKWIPKEEMFRFSHQVPSCLLTGEEGQNAPKGCRELDPAAVPLDFLQVITEFKDDEMLEGAERKPVS